MSKYPVIAIFGQKNNGKSTLANLIADAPLRLYSTWNYPPCVLTGFAHGMKSSLAELLGFDRIKVDELKNDPVPPPGMRVSMRAALQMFGNGMRDIMPLVWINRTLVAANHYPIIIEDGRYLNECEAVKAVGGMVIKITRRSHTIHQSSEDFKNLHISEQEPRLIEPHLSVHNNDDKEVLRRCVDGYVIPAILEHFNKDANVT